MVYHSSQNQEIVYKAEDIPDDSPKDIVLPSDIEDVQKIVIKVQPQVGQTPKVMFAPLICTGKIHECIVGFIISNKATRWTQDWIQYNLIAEEFIAHGLK